MGTSTRNKKFNGKIKYHLRCFRNGAPCCGIINCKSRVLHCATRVRCFDYLLIMLVKYNDGF